MIPQAYDLVKGVSLSSLGEPTPAQANESHDLGKHSPWICPQTTPVELAQGSLSTVIHKIWVPQKICRL